MTSLLLGDLNDYIQPSVACIRPSTPLPKNVPVAVNLSDCLACSGCITSAESVLISEQTHHQLYDVLTQNVESPEEKRKTIVVSVCASTRTALCRLYKMGPIAIWRRLYYFFRNVLQVDLLLDTTFGYNFALKASAIEFVERYQEARQSGETMKPMLSSECPGWICYAEKKQAGMLPQICTVRSPQQIIGTLVKTYIRERLQKASNHPIKDSDIFHVSIQACYDKKLEASREDFAQSGTVRDVDCVIVTTELLKMIEETYGKDFMLLPEAELDQEDPFRTWFCEPIGNEMKLQRHQGSSAGGYLFYIMRYAAKVIFDLDISPDIINDPHVVVQQHRNIDFTEYILYGGREVLRFAAIYGFRNIQTFVQKAKHHKIDYHYVELMACPGACLFGGGQPKIGTGKQIQDEHRGEMEKLFRDTDEWIETVEVDRIWEWYNSDPQRRKLLHTSYRSLEEVEKKPRINVFW